MRLVPNSSLFEPIFQGIERIQWRVERFTGALSGVLGLAWKSGRNGKHASDIQRMAGAQASAPTELVNLPAIAERVAAHMEREADSRSIQVEIDFAPDALVMSDHEAVHAMIHALFCEALKRTPPGGTLTLSGSVCGGYVLLQFASEGSGANETTLELRLPISPGVAEDSTLSLAHV